MNISRLVRSSGFRISAYYTIAFVVSLLILLISLYWIISTALQKQLRDTIGAEMMSLVEIYDTEGRPALQREIAEKKWISPQIGGAYFLAMSGTGSIGNVEIATRSTGWQTLPPADVDDDEDHQFMGLGHALPDGGYLFVGADVFRMRAVQEAILKAFGWTAGIGIFVALLGGVVLSQNVLRQIDAITSTSVAIMHGDLQQRIPIRGTSDELDRLATSLNDMLDRIHVLMESLKHVSSNIAHDLRTPLSRLRQHLESALMRAKSAPDYRKAIEESIVEADILLSTFSALLRIADIEAGTRKVGFRPLSLHKLFSSVAQAYGPVAEEGGRPFTAELTAEAQFEGDSELLTQMLANIVENAMRHTPAGTAIRLTLCGGNGVITGSVSDNGPGIPETERSKVLERFYRLSHSRTTPGTGLGLSLVAAIADLHAIDLKLADNEPGLNVKLQFCGLAVGGPGSVSQSAMKQ